MPRKKTKTSDRKSRLTLSLEKTTVQYLYQYKVATKSPSVSACVESLLIDYRRYSEAEELGRQTTALYDSISDHERQENAAWGRISEREFISSSSPSTFERTKSVRESEEQTPAMARKW
jgi:hypothetical protein